MDNYPKPVTKENHKKILEYLDNSICQIKGIKEKYGIGFFCSLKCHDKTIFLLITNYQIINENYLKNFNYIEVLINKEIIRIELKNKYYMDKNLDLSVIEIKENKNEIIKILQLDNDIYEENSKIYLNRESIYIINNNSVSYGIINDISKYELKFYCNLNMDSYCYPIFNLTTNKLIGIYQTKSKYYHKGLFFKYIIEQLESKYTKNDMKNEIKIEINIDDKDIKNKITYSIELSGRDFEKKISLSLPNSQNFQFF